MTTAATTRKQFKKRKQQPTINPILRLFLRIKSEHFWPEFDTKETEFQMSCDNFFFFFFKTCQFCYFHPNGGPSWQEHFVKSWAFGKDQQRMFWHTRVQRMDKMHALKNTHFCRTHSHTIINMFSTLSCDVLKRFETKITLKDLKKKQQKDSKSYNYCSIKSIDK